MLAILNAQRFEKMWWKPLITGSQMGHHLLIMSYMVANRVSGNPDCTWSVCFYAVLWGLSILGLFANFFYRSYARKERKE